MADPSNIVARFLDATSDKEGLTPSLKNAPIQKMVDRASREIEKAVAGINRHLKAVGSHDSYRGDPSKIGPALQRVKKSCEALNTLFTAVRRDVNTFMSAKAHEANAGDTYAKRTYDDVEERWNKAVRSYQNYQESFREFDAALTANDIREAKSKSWSIDTMVDFVAREFKNFAFSFDYLTRPNLENPAETGKDSTPVQKLEAFINAQVMGVAKVAAKKLGNDPASCAVLGGDVLEDVNAHTALKAVQPLVGHYYKDLDEVKTTAVRSLVGQVSGAFRWDIVRSAAFMVGIMRVARCPEANAVLARIAESYASQGVFDDE